MHRAIPLLDDSRVLIRTGSKRKAAKKYEDTISQSGVNRKVIASVSTIQALHLDIGRLRSIHHNVRK